MDLKDFIKAKEKLNSQFRKGDISQQELNKAMTKLRNSRDAARKGRLEKTPFGRFMNWLTTPAPLSQIIEPLKGPATKKKTTAQTAAGENIGAKKGAKPQTKTSERKPVGRKTPIAKPKAKRQAPKFDPTGMKLPKAKAKPKAKTKTEEKRRVPIDVQTGKPKFNAPKVSDAVRLKQEDQYKRNQETKKMEAKLKKRSDDLRKAKSRAK
tara:strand:+ start:232 stop:858 length:627 start_codon:yes stop_codon:yes gene_type:complete